MMKRLIVIAVAALVAGSSFAGLVIAYEDERTAGNAGALEKLGDDIVAQAGDVVVITAAKSKALAYTYGITSSDGGAADAGTHHAWDGTKTVDLIVFNITTGGTFDFDATPAATSFTTFGAYLLRADYGSGESLSLLDSDANYEASGIPTNTSSLTFAETSGIVIETYSSGSGTTMPFGLDGKFNNTATNRVTATGTFTDASSQDFNWVLADTSKNSRTAGIAFEAVPEPATLGIVAFGGLSILFIRRRFKI